MLRKMIAESYDKTVFSFVRDHCYFFESGCTILPSQKYEMEFLLLHFLVTVWWCHRLFLCHSIRYVVILKVGKTTRSFRSDLNKIPYDYTVEVTTRFKASNLMNRVPEELWTEVNNIVQ